MRARSLGLLVAGALVAAGLPLVGTAAPATALEAPVAFTATALSTWQTDGIVWATAASQGKVFVGGSFSHLRPPGTAQGDAAEVARSNFAVIDAATGAPLDCAPAALASGADATAQTNAATVRSLDVSPDGSTLYVGGFFGTFGGLNRSSMAALDVSSCTVVSGWAPNPTGPVRAIAATSSTVYFGGQFVQVSSGAVNRLHAAAAVAVGQANAGSITAWDPSTTSPVNSTANTPDVRAIVVKPGGGEVVIGGDFENVGGTASHALAAVDPTTGALVWALDRAHVPWVPTCASTSSDLDGYSSNVKSLVADASGFYTGNEGTGCGSFDGRTKWSWDHVLLWKDGCLGATQSLVLYSNALYSASHAHNCSSIAAYPDGARRHLLAETLTARGDSDPNVSPYPYPALLPFFPNTNDGDVTLFPRETGLEGIGPRAMTVATTAGQDYLWVVGEFTTVNGAAQQGLTRFGQTTNSQPTLPVVSVSSFTPGSARVAWLPSIDNDDATLTYTLERSANAGQTWTAIGTPTQQVSWFWERPQLVYVDTDVTMGSTYKYRVKVNDGTITRTSGERSVTITNIGADLGGGTFGPSAYEAAVLADSPELYVRYDETGDVYLADRSDNRDHLVFKGGGTFGTGLLASDSSRSLTMGGGAGQVAYGQKLLASPTNYSLETWFTTTTTTGGKLIGFGDKQDYASTNYDKMVWMTDAGRLVFGVAPGGSKTRLITPAPVTDPGTGACLQNCYNDGLRHHLVAVQDSTTGMAIYIDGALVASNSTKTNQTFKGYWHVGGDNLASWAGTAPYVTTSYAFQGTLDETAIYHSALSPARISAHYAAADQTGVEVAPLTPQKPTVTVGSPTEGATVKGVVDVSVFGGTTPGTTSHPASLQLVVDGSPVGAAYDCGSTGSSCSHTFSWDTSGVSAGAHTVAARITTNGVPAAPNDTATSTAVNVTVQASLPPQAPSVTIDSPAASAVVGPGSVDIHASASTVTNTVSYPASLDLFVDGKGPVTSVPCSGTTYDCSGVLTWDTAGLYGAHTIAVRANATSECAAVAGTCSTTTSARSVKVSAGTRTTLASLATRRSGTTATVTGKVVVAVTGSPAAVGVPVQIVATPAVGAAVTKYVTTGTGGAFTASFVVSLNTTFVASVRPTGWAQASTSSAVRQYVTRAPTCALSATTVKYGSRLTATCRRSGMPAGTATYLQYLSSSTWRTLTKASSRSGITTLSFIPKRRGYWYLRLVVASTTYYVASASATMRIRVV